MQISKICCLASTDQTLWFYSNIINFVYLRCTPEGSSPLVVASFKPTTSVLTTEWVEIEVMVLLEILALAFSNCLTHQSISNCCSMTLQMRVCLSLPLEICQFSVWLWQKDDEHWAWEQTCRGDTEDAYSTIWLLNGKESWSFVLLGYNLTKEV